MTPQEELTRYFEVCGYEPDDLISIGTRAGAEGPLFFSVVPVSEAPRQIEARSRVNCWFGANPIQRPEPTPDNPHPRGEAKDVVAVRALWADLDIKTGGMPDKKSARAVMQALSDILGVRPVAVVWSGHGFQPRWKVDERGLELHSPERMTPVIEGFGRLVQLVAERHGGKADSVYDLARIIRAPHTTNLKPGLEPTPTKVWLYPDAGFVSFERLVEVLDEYLPASPPAAPGKAQAGDNEFRHVGIERGNAYTLAAIEAIRTELAEIADWPAGRTDEKDRGWEKIQADAAFRLASLAKADWNELTVERAKEIFCDACPIDESWTIRDVIKKWGSQVKRAEAADPPAVVDDPLAPGYRGDVSPHRSAADEAAIWSTDPGEGPSEAGPGDMEPAPAPVSWKKYSWDDFGNADRTVTLYRDVLRWAPAMKRWLQYENGAWRETETGGERCVQDMLRQLHRLEGPLYSDVPVRDGRKMQSEQDKFTDWLEQNRAASKVSAAAKTIKNGGDLDVSPTLFDAEPMLLNAPNGVVDLRTGDLLEHDPALLLRRQIPVPYDRDAKAPRWEAFLERVMPSPDMRDYLQRIIGYTITGRTSEQVVFFHVGPPASGKSVFLRVLEAVLGEFSRVVPPTTLLSKKMEQHPTDVMGMEGRRMLAVDETPEGIRLDEALLKRLSGEGTLTARGMGENFRDFKIVGKVHLVTNHPPHISDDQAIHRRLHVVPWSITIPADERDPMLAENILREDLPGVLAWAVRGSQRWSEVRLARPVEAELARSEYIASEDEFGQFIDEELIVGAEAFTESKVVFRRYVQWCEGQRMKPMSMVAFGRKLSARGIEPRRTMTARGFKVALALPQWTQDPLG